MRNSGRTASRNASRPSSTIRSSEECFIPASSGISVRRKHRTQLKRQHPRKSPANLSIRLRFLLRRLPMQPRRLKQNRHPAKLNNPPHLPPVQRHNVATLPLNVSASNKRHSRPQRLASPPQHLALLRITQIIHIPSIHIHSAHQPSLSSRNQMPLKRLNRNTPIRLKRQQRRSNSLHRPSQFTPLDHRFNLHVFSHAVVAPVFQSGRPCVVNA